MAERPLGKTSRLPSAQTLPGAESLTLGEVLAQVAAARPKATALIWGRRSISYGELDQKVTALARGLLRIGVEPGEVLGLLVEKRPEMVLFFLAAARMGAIVAPINHKLPTPRVERQLRRGGIRRALIGPTLLEVAASLSGALDLRQCIFCRDSLSPWAHTVDDLLDTGMGPIGVTPRPDDVVYLNYTSGSTGRPKGAETTHRHLQANAISTISHLGMTQEDVFLGMFTSFSHPHELFHRTLNLGGASVLLDSWNPRIIARAIQTHKVTWMMAVPSLYEMMLRRDPIGSDISSLRVMEAGGAYVSAQSLEAYEAHFGVDFIPVWGSTETVGVAIALEPGASRPDGALGRPCPGYTFEVVGEDDEILEAEEVGELVVRGPGVVDGYLGAQVDGAARRLTLSDGDQEPWYRTGDLVRRDGDGVIFFHARRSEMLKVGGLRVYPLEVELAIEVHPEVEDAAVLGAEDDIRGEVPRAIVTLKPGSSLTVADLRAHCLKTLAGYKVPRFIEIWPSLPTLPNGKVDRRALSAPRSP